MDKIDKKDLKILQALDKNVRSSYTQISREVGLSKETVQYRIKRLQSSKVLVGFWALPRLGNTISIYKIFLKNKGMNSQSLIEFKEFLLKNNVVSWVAECEGYWNYIVTITSKKDFESCQFLQELFKKFSSHFLEIQFLKSIRAIAFAEKYLYSQVPTHFFEDSFISPNDNYDFKDELILNELSKNSRATLQSMSEVLKLTSEAVAARLRNLKKKNAIVFLKPRISHEKLGYSYYHLMLRISEIDAIEKIIIYFRYSRECVFIMEHVGKYQLHAEIVCKSTDTQAFLSKFMDGFAESIGEYDLCKIACELKIRLNQQ